MGSSAARNGQLQNRGTPAILTLATLRRVAKALKCPVHDLLT